MVLATLYIDILSWTDITAINMIISPNVEGGQIHLNVMTLVSSSKSSTDTKRGFIDVKYFI